MRCVNPSCGSTEIDFSEASGDAVCVVCGTVCEESAIVSSIEFSENAGGASSVVGQFVSASCTKPYGGGGGMGGFGKGKRFGFLRSSRETTLATGRRKIAQVASSLRLGAFFVDGAQRLFSMAAQRNFNQGRKSLHVACACLYVMCRREKSAHMLIDFSDVLQVNVYSLGSTFLKFRRLLNLELPLIDPSLYIHRFAAKLELGDKAPAVASTALRVVQRMKRDWIETGRRPAGVCAAALLIGARAHGFDRCQDDVVRALKVCGMTVTKRLADFQRTPAAQLSLSDFTERSEAMDTEENPPSFQQRQLLLEGSWSIVPLPPGGKSHHRSCERHVEYSRARAKLYDEIRLMLEADQAGRQQIVEQPRPNASRKRPALDTTSDDEFEDVKDEDIEGFILTEAEVAKKSELWTETNKDYLAARDERDRLARARAEASGEAPQDASSRPKKKTKKKKQDRTAKEALIDVCERKRFSRKINYAALAGIFGDDEPDRADNRQLVGSRVTNNEEDRARLVARDPSTRDRDHAAPKETKTTALRDDAPAEVDDDDDDDDQEILDDEPYDGVDEDDYDEEYS
ncbi:hypothetical protein CTAYLR_001373 [Chrysophaeum taylorii]|uniref:B-related factor 1 n=1 Tax=Chrysophaeum taylorii TaxID=2483200 RepID=A0AAD7U5C8_9STRA|nr:hypothetical protein CTAYLR_001373 [Chrysophaeum taylorii]